MNSKRQLILHWAEQGYIEDGDVNSALIVSGARPTHLQWFQFIKHLLLWLGVTSLAAGTVFFFAFNWDAISNLVKFSILQGALLTITLTYIFAYDRLGSSNLAHNAISFLIAMLIGALLALSGQVYQTGADPWQLFAIWALFITPLAIINRSSVLWLLWVVLINLSLYLYYQVFRGLFGLLFRDDELVSIFLALNTLLFISFECAYHSKKSLIESRLVAQTCLLFAGIFATWLAIWAIFDSSDIQWGLPCYLLWISGVFLYYRYRSLDLFALSGCVTSGIVVISCLLIHIFGDALDGGAFLIISMLIIGLSSAAGIWLKNLSKLSAASEQPIHREEEQNNA